MNTPPVSSRRERVRAATVEEIQQVARELLVQESITGVSLRAIAREMGMTAAALYRYFPSFESLMASLCAQFYDECRIAMELARDRASTDNVGTRLYAMCRTFRTWSVAHPAEFNLMFSSPLPGLKAMTSESDDTSMHRAHGAGIRFARSFAELFAELWLQKPFRVTPDDEVPPPLGRQLRAFVEELVPDGTRPGVTLLPIGAAQLFLSCWIRIYGIVALEVYGHLHFALTDVGPMFDAELDACAQLLGIDPGEHHAG